MPHVARKHLEANDPADIVKEDGSMKITLPYPPSVNRYWTPNGRGGLTLSEEGRAYKEVAGWHARSDWW